MITFKWEIDNISNASGRNPIVSPSFFIEASNTLKFCLKLYILAHRPLVQMILVLWRCDNDRRSIELKYKLQINSSSSSVWIPSSAKIYRYNFQTPMEFPLDQVFLTKSIDDYGSSLQIACEIFYHDVIFQDVDEQVMEDLSSQYATLLKDDTFSDIPLQVGNYEFNVHKAILEARCDLLARKLETETFTDPQFFKSILQFVYSGKLQTCKDNVILLLRDTNSPLFHAMSSFIISEISAKTLIKVSTYRFDWMIENFMNVKYENIFSYVKVEDNNHIKLSLFPNRKEDNIELDFLVECLDHGTYFIRGSLYIQDQNGTLHKVSHVQSSGINKSPLVVFNSCCISTLLDMYPNCMTNGAIKLTICIDVSRDNEHTTNFDIISCKNISPDIMNMYYLRKAFQKLLENPSYSDFKVKVVFSEDKMFLAHKVLLEHSATVHNPKVFSVHKAILSARSDVFCCMFRYNTIENRKNEVKIEDLEADVIYSMLLYMYCGQLNDLNLNFAIKLYYAADKYQILMLKEKCSKFLESIINSDNNTKIQYHAEIHSDDILKNACLSFSRA